MLTVRTISEAQVDVRHLAHQMAEKPEVFAEVIGDFLAIVRGVQTPVNPLGQASPVEPFVEALRRAATSSMSLNVLLEIAVLANMKR